MLKEGVADSMDGDKFDVLMGILRILEKKRNPEIMDSVLEIIDAYDDTLSPEQKARVLKNFLEFRKQRDEESEKKMEEAVRMEQKRAMLHPDFSV